MTVYIIALLIIFILAFFKIKDKTRIICSLLVLIGIFSLRDYHVGVDIPGYYDKFLRIARMPWDRLFDTNTMWHHYEKGFIVFDKLISYLTNNANVYLFICAVAIYVPIIYFYFRRVTSNAQWCVAIYMCLPSYLVCLSGLRQAIAVSITLIGFTCMEEGRRKTAVCIHVLAVLFHQTAIAAVLYYLIKQIHFKKYDFWKVVLVGIGIFLLRFTVLKTALSILAVFTDKGQTYETYDTGAYGVLMMYGLMIIFTFCLASKKTDESPDFLVNRNILILTTYVQIFASTQSNLARMTYYFLPFVPIAIMDVINNGLISNKNYSKLLTKVAIMIMFFAFYLKQLHGGTNMHLVPYQFFW